MPLELSWQGIAIRLTFSVLAGLSIGINREERGRAAGLRTTVLVCLAAAVSMIQVNLLLPQAGKPNSSFVVLDLMRLPLGILSGMGFIGGGAILRRGDRVRGVTTAATLWFVTVIGLCFGGGQLSLGLAATGLALMVLWGFKWIERHAKQSRRARLTLVAAADSVASEEVRSVLTAEGFYINASSAFWSNTRATKTWNFDVYWRARRGISEPPLLAERLAALPGVISLHWRTLEA